MVTSLVDEPTRTRTSVSRLMIRARRHLPAGVAASRDPVASGLLALALVVGSALRFTALGSVGLNSDEAVYAAQAGSLAGNPHFSSLFPIVRAHPLLFQMLLSPLYRHGVPDVPGRYVAAAFGVGTLALTYLLGRILFNARVGALAALLLAVMPYHVVLSRQIMLDGPMTFFATGALVCVAIAARRRDGLWLLAAGALLGLAALSKEPAIILLGSGFAFVALTSRIRRSLRYSTAGAGLAIALILAYPLLTAISGGSRGGQSYLAWQLAREPNHTLTFYFTAVGAAMGFVLLAVAGLGLMIFHRRWSWRETLLASWLVVPFVYFEAWPTKGFSYLLPLAPVVAVLAAVALVRLAGDGHWWRRALVAGLAGACVISLLVPSMDGIVSPTTSGLAGAGGIPGGREAGRWVANHAPPGAQFMTIGPSMANIIQYYGGRRSDGLSVSPNPLHRNPSYTPIANADLALRRGQYQYIVWDTYSARRSTHFSGRALDLVRRFHGVPVDVERDSQGHRLIVIYQVSS
ncbi:ArnT family glycosyltransferase [Leekyejoonella antrihumi]|nr:glycosyltransferase family 39 protein [Leekyejoonella antrihumi]